MSEIKITNIKVSDCLKLHFKVLAWVGFYRPMIFYESRTARVSHKIYRNFIFILMLVYNLQHAIFAAQWFRDMDKLIVASLILLTTINNICKMITLYWNTERLLNLMNIMDGPLFAPLDSDDEKILKQNSKIMNFLLKPCHTSVMLCCTMWCIAPFVNRASGNEVVIPAYFPFNTESMTGFCIKVLYENILMAWVGIGHTTIDCIIASFYIQSKAQFQLLSHHLQHITDIAQDGNGDTLINHVKTLQYYDDDKKYAKKLQEKFVYNVQKFDKIHWFINEVESIFNNAIVVQLIVSSCIFCVVVFKMSQLISLSFDFFYLLQYNISLLLELLLYCYFGTQAEYASYNVNDAIYSSKWICLSAKFRRQILIAMTRWSRPLKPCAASIIPLSLASFIGVIKMSYSLYTILNKTSN